MSTASITASPTPTIPARRPSSPSPSSRVAASLGSKISALGAKISRTLSHTGDEKEREREREQHLREKERALNGGEDEENDSVAPILYRANTQDNMTDAAERSTSRGRETFSTGRGGLGNIRQTSVSRDARPSTGPDDFSVTRGREPAPAAVHGGAQVFSTGRGGAGNLRSPSRTPRDVKEAAQAEAAEQEVIREYVASQEHAVKSSGRGGIGNINRSRSRGPHTALDSPTSNSHSPSRPSTTSNTGSPAPVARFSTGRGGAGNILNEGGHGQTGYSAEAADEEERRRVALGAGAANANAYHSTGRGGNANYTTAHEPPVERRPQEHAHVHGDGHEHQYQSTGRGGAGNIVRGD